MVPTLLNLFGIEYDSAVYLGEDLFNEKHTFINSRKGGFFDNQFFSEDGYNITNLDPNYVAYKDGKLKDVTPEQKAEIDAYEEKIKQYRSSCSDFLIKSNYMNMMYDCDYFASRTI